MPGPPLSLLTETLRIVGIAERFVPLGANAEACVRALHDDSRAPRVGFSQRLHARLFWRHRAKPYGSVWTFHYAPFFCTAKVPFIAVLGPDGRASVLFDREPRYDLFPYVARFVVDRVCAGNGWRFPDDLDRPGCAEAVWDLLWAGWATLASAAPLTRAAAAAEVKGRSRGSLAVKARWRYGDDDERPATVRWKWDELTLDRSLVDDPPAGA